MTERAYRQENLARQYLFSKRVGTVQYQDYLEVNRKTGTLTVSHTWFKNAGHLLQRKEVRTYELCFADD